jgi:hypothetical protein
MKRRNQTTTTLLIKISLSLVVALCAVHPLLGGADGSGVLNEAGGLGASALLTLVVLFLVAVFFYCKALSTCLALIPPANRVATPRSVWLMFLLPYNFIEDFFIIHHVARSIEKEAEGNEQLAALNSTGLTSGLGWCIAQLLSLVPGAGGAVAGVVALVLWIHHWVFIRRVIRLLKSDC